MSSTPGLSGPSSACAGGRLLTRFGPFDWLCARDPSNGRPALALFRGAVHGDEPLLARVHSSCVTSEVLGARDCDCAEQLADSLARLAEAGRGVLFYLMQEGRGAGLAAKARDRMMVQSSRQRLTTFEAYARLGLPRDARRYEAVAALRARLGIRAPLRLLTNNPEKVAGLASAGVPLAETLPLQCPASSFSLHYLEAKREAGHALCAVAGGARVARLPEAVRWREPAPVPGAPQLLHVASYLLPVAPPPGAAAGPGVRWLRARVYLDQERGRERIVAVHGPDRGAATLRRVQRHRLGDRLPLLRRPASARRWAATLEAMTARGSGRALFLEADEQAPPDAVTRMLLRHEPPAE